MSNDGVHRILKHPSGFVCKRGEMETLTSPPYLLGVAGSGFHVTSGFVLRVLFFKFGLEREVECCWYSFYMLLTPYLALVHI